MLHLTRVCLALACMLLAGCGMSEAKNAAEQEVGRHFQRIASGAWDAVIDAYAPGFFEKTSKEEWKTFLVRVADKAGAYQSHSVTSWRVFEGIGTTSGTHVSLTCNVVYAKHELQETFTLMKSDDGAYRIVGHHVEAGPFLME